MKKLVWWSVIGLVILGLGISAFVLRDQLMAQAEIARLTIALEQNPKNFDAAFGLGVAYFKTRDYSQSIAYYAKAIAINDASAESYNNMGNAHRKLLRYQDAEKSYLDAIGVAPDFTTSYVNLVNLYESWPTATENKLLEIPKLLERGLKSDPENATLLRELISYYKKMGDTAKAGNYQGVLDGL